MIRSAEPADAAAVSELLRQLGYSDQDGVAARIRSWQVDPMSAAYVADADGDVLGVVAIHVGPYFERTGNWARVVALVVSARARGQGIGGQLMAAAEEFAAEHGCLRIELSSADRRTEAHVFYERRGYVNQSGRSSWFRREAARQ
ncbi:GNAT family N-acetyltransferase [Kribbella sp. NPDC051587]|uniref:GNAT family N-acetyltransferase n=1 Tax=Kribbella sp. NPDC051587 TaxID=3364119 RepID=UPI0037B06D0C